MEFQNNYPIYLQIADDIKRRIVIGELHPVTSCPPTPIWRLLIPVQPQYGTANLPTTGSGRHHFHSPRRGDVPERRPRTCGTVTQYHLGTGSDCFPEKNAAIPFFKGCTLYSHRTAVGTSGKKGRNRNNRQKLNQKEQRDYVNI